MLTKDQAVHELAAWHFDVEPDLTRVVRFIARVEGVEDDPAEPIKLLEVNGATVATGSVEAFAFSASASVPYPVIIAEVTPEEWELIRKREIPLPTGWTLENSKEIERPQAA